MAVDAAGGKEAEEMESAAALFCRLNRRSKGSVIKKGTIPNRPIDTGKLLIHHTPRADIRMPHLGVPHLPLGQPHRFSGANQRRQRIAGHEIVQNRRLSHRDSIILRRRIAVSPPVHDDQHDGRCL